MGYRPLSARGRTGTSFDALHEGIPTWLRAWLRPFIRTYTTTGSVHYFTDWMRNLQVRMHLIRPCRGIKAAAKPIVAPRDADATLGKMLRTIKDAPQKFKFTLGDSSVVVPVMEAMWTTHVRHGTDDPEAPMGMSQDEADAAVYLALTLVRCFAGGAITRI